MEPNETFMKVHNENKTQMYRIKIEWENGYFRLFIFEGTNSWFALVTKEHVKMLAEQRDLEPVVYFNNLREYICSNQSSLISNIVKKQFIIFRSNEKKKIRMKYFFVNLEELNYQETIESVVDDLSTKYTQMQAKLKALEEQKMEVESQKLMYENKCVEFVELKRKSDLQMYSAFALALNEKKHRIRFLTELLEEHQAEGNPKFNKLAASSITRKHQESKAKPTPILPSSSTANKSKETISDSESEPNDGYDTEDERNANNEPIPGTSTHDLDFLGGDSPPPLSLPKRIKIDRKKTSESILVKSPPKNVNQTVKANGSQTKAMDVQDSSSGSDDESGTFNTQELLDRM